MMLRAIIFIIWVLAGACATAQEPESVGPRIIAIGDLHGDYEAFEQLMAETGLANDRGKWIGGDTIFVQTGDVPDRGPDSLKIITYLRKLQKQAHKKGGRVVTLVGNHEAMNINGDLRYVHPGEYEAFADRQSKGLRERIYESNREQIEPYYLEQDATLSSTAIKEKWISDTPLGKIEHQRAWRPDGEVGEWASRNFAVAIAGDSLFVHGGISAKYTLFSVDELNAAAAEALAARSTDPDSIINDEAGPLWYRGLIRRDEPANESNAEDDDQPLAPAYSTEEEIDLVLGAFGVSRIVVGHTPSLEGIKASYGGKLIQIDTGIAAYYGGTRSFLEIKNGALYAHDNGMVTPLTLQETEQ